MNRINKNNNKSKLTSVTLTPKNENKLRDTEVRNTTNELFEMVGKFEKKFFLIFRIFK